MTLILRTRIACRRSIHILRVQSTISSIGYAVLVDVVGIDHLHQRWQTSFLIDRVLLNCIVIADLHVERSGEELATNSFGRCIDSLRSAVLRIVPGENVGSGHGHVGLIIAV